MKKLRLIAGIAIVMMLCCLLAVGASAKWWDDNPFTDVKSTSWYYDAVRICNENGLFGGMSETTFATSTGMTRSMFVTVLAAADENYDESQYTKSSFSDIREGSWYLAPAEWANSIGIAKGIGNGIFAPKNTITRQELALMLYKYAEYKGKDVSLDGSVDLNVYPDNSDASSWATTALEWSVQNGLISGVASGNEVVLSPKGTATRAMVAQIMVNYLALDPVREINGNDISLYQIVYSPDEIESVGDAAHDLARGIEKALGYTLPVVTDEAEVSDYEILVGRTNREEKGIVSVEHDFDEDQTYVWTVQGNYLVIYGVDTTYDTNTIEDKSGRNVDGTENSVFMFTRDVLGLYQYSDPIEYGGEDYLYVADPDPVISLEDGYYFSDFIWYRKRTFYMKGSVCGAGDYEKSFGGNMTMWITDDWAHEEDHLHDSTPCLTDEAHIQAVITNVLKKLEEKPKVSVISMGINDSDSYCTCENCNNAYREYRGRSATLALIANRVSDAIAEKYPNVSVQIGAYSYAQVPPKNLTLRDNIIIEFYTVANCSGHSYRDTSCSLNKNLANNFNGWDNISDGGFVIWDHTGGFMHFMTPQPDWDTLLENVRFFADGNGREILMNSVFYGEDLPNGESPDYHADLGSIRAYMLSMIYLDPFMTDEEFSYRLNDCLEANYGDGWQNIREYIDIIAELGNSCCHKFHAAPSGHYNFDEVCEKADYIDALWEDAIAKAEGGELERLLMHQTSWIYLRQCATYESRCLNGTEAQKAKYAEQNEYLYNCILDMRLMWTEGTLNLLDNYSSANSPERW